MNGASATSSRVNLFGGFGGNGREHGDPGLPWEGTLTDSPVMPYLRMDGDFRPSGAFALDLDLVQSGGVLFTFADHQGFLPVYGNAGPPLGAVPFPGGRWVLFFAGDVSALGHLTIPLTLPSDPGLIGTAVCMPRPSSSRTTAVSCCRIW